MLSHLLGITLGWCLRWSHHQHLAQRHTVPLQGTVTIQVALQVPIPAEYQHKYTVGAFFSLDVKNVVFDIIARK